MRRTIKSTASNVSQKIYLDMLGYINNDIPQAFASYAQDSGVQRKFGMGKMMELAASVALSKAPIKALRNLGKDPAVILAPFIDHVNKYIKEQMENWAKRVPTLIDSDIKNMEADLHEQVGNFDLRMEEAAMTFATGNAKSPVASGGSGVKAGVQSLLALLNWDVSLAVGVNAEGGMSWIEFAKRAAVQLALDAVVTMLFGAPFLVPALLIEVISLKYRAGEMGGKLLSSVGNAAFDGLSKRIQEEEVSFKEKIVRSFTDKGEELAKTALGQVADAEKNQKRLLKENASDQAAADAENNRVDQNLKEMHRLIDNVYYELYHRKPTQSEFDNLAKNEKKKAG